MIERWIQDEMEFRGEKYVVHRRFYKCLDTGEQFTSTEQDELWTNELYSQYLLHHGLPFPDEVVDIRSKYGLTLNQITKILGFGVNQYSQYEKGRVPSESNGKLILSMKDSKMALTLLASSKSEFSESEYQECLEKISNANKIAQQDSDSAIVYGGLQRSAANGYAPLSTQRLSEMVNRILKLAGESFATKLNKLMFYCDFLHYRNFGNSISGLAYKALQYGPVPIRYSTVYDNLKGIEAKEILAHGMASIVYSPKLSLEGTSLTENEKDSIDSIIHAFGGMSVTEIVETSHKESVWKEYLGRLIPYSEAFNLSQI